MSIKIIGCGKCGNNIVDNLQQLNLPRVEYYSMNLSSKNEKDMDNLNKIFNSKFFKLLH